MIVLLDHNEAKSVTILDLPLTQIFDIYTLTHILNLPSLRLHCCILCAFMLFGCSHPSPRRVD
jgi:hypothetical protein